MTKFVLLT